MTAPSVDIVSRTDPGRIRPHNEDAAGAYAHPRGDAWLLVVADGLGGLADGAAASATALDAISIAFLTTPEPTAATIRNSVAAANAAIFARSGGDEQKLSGTTIVGLLLAHGHVTAFHAGDSRAFRLRQQRLEQVTRDHSLVSDQVAAGMLTPDQARVSPARHVVTRCLGVDRSVELDVRDLGQFAAGDVYLVCSDGLHGMLSAEEIGELLSMPAELDVISQHMVDSANARGGIDNISVAIARVL